MKRIVRPNPVLRVGRSPGGKPCCYSHHLLWTLGTSQGRAQAPSTYLRWPCVGLGWGGLAGVVAGTCLHLVFPVGDVVAGTHPSCSGKAGTGKCKLRSLHPSVCWRQEDPCQGVCTYLVPPWALLNRCRVLPGLFPICQQ